MTIKSQLLESRTFRYLLRLSATFGGVWTIYSRWWCVKEQTVYLQTKQHSVRIKGKTHYQENGPVRFMRKLCFRSGWSKLLAVQAYRRSADIHPRVPDIWRSAERLLFLHLDDWERKVWANEGETHHILGLVDPMLVGGSRMWPAELDNTLYISLLARSYTSCVDDAVWRGERCRPPYVIFIPH